MATTKITCSMKYIGSLFLNLNFLWRQRHSFKLPVPHLDVNLMYLPKHLSRSFYLLNTITWVNELCGRWLFASHFLVFHFFFLKNKYKPLSYLIQLRPEKHVWWGTDWTQSKQHINHDQLRAPCFHRMFIWSKNKKSVISQIHYQSSRPVWGKNKHQNPSVNERIQRGGGVKNPSSQIQRLKGKKS